ncbi:formylglycine-generating enzyme family protein [Elizabethkingia anophelis]|uniref:formylglycine-generating enzyme family protein n=1 Tax=Elizabethkingia anophelis TaxID=1117645 RepID=UPI003733BC66|nr:formylglycine-generating enzyme family protein [Elizabethkingia anophelis]
MISIQRLIFVCLSITGVAYSSIANGQTKTTKLSCCEVSGSKARQITTQKKTNSPATTIPLKDKSPVDVTNKMVLIPAGTFMMGSNGDEWSRNWELPQHKVSVKSFYMDTHEVTNAEFEKFVIATGYITTAEKPVDWEALKKELPPDTPKPSDEDLMPGSMVFASPESVNGLDDYSQWWRWVKGADWQHPLGPGSNIKGKEKHPVVHVSYYDAVAYAKWIGKRLPTEAEWEWAARGGLDNKIYPWGDEHISRGSQKANYWTGTFPIKNTEKDGYYYTAPVGSYAPNAYGLYDMAGNVWEICSDWFSENYYQSLQGNQITNNPAGPSKPYYPSEPFANKRVVRGGSFLCNDSYCASYRVSARMPYSEDTGMIHTGFRLVKDPETK